MTFVTTSPVNGPVEAAPGPRQVQFGDVSFYGGPENFLLRHTIQRLTDGSLEDEPPQPLVFYGEHGCGKSLVLRGLVQAWKSLRTAKCVLATSADEFRRAFNNAVQADDFSRLHNIHRSASLLAIDDVHHLAGKVPSQNWLANLIEERTWNAQPTVLTCRRPLPAEPQLLERLKSRAASGLAVGISSPGAETRRVVIQDWVQALDLPLTAEEIDDLVARTAAASVPQIRAAVTSLRMEPAKSPRRARDDDGSSAADAGLSRKILQETAKKFGVRVRDLAGPSRRKSVVVPRAAAMFLMRELTNMSLMEIGLHFRRRDHTTVLHACRKIEKKLSEDPPLRACLVEIRELLHIPAPAHWRERSWGSVCE